VDIATGRALIQDSREDDITKAALEEIGPLVRLVLRFIRVEDIRVDPRLGIPRVSSKRTRFIEIASAVGLWLVMTGIIGEGIFEFLGARPEGDLRDFSNGLVVRAQAGADGG
jgi:hypothetical protein